MATLEHVVYWRVLQKKLACDAHSPRWPFFALVFSSDIPHRPRQAHTFQRLDQWVNSVSLLLQIAQATSG